MICRFVVVGGSWGGLDAVVPVLASMPRDLPVLVALHRGPGPSQLAALVSRRTGWEVREAEDRDELEPGVVHLAPPGYHLMVDGDRVALSTEGQVRHSRPSIDVLFESAADSWGQEVVGVLLTGASDDGAAGLAAIVARGGHAVVQDPSSAERDTMPLAALSRVPEATVLALGEIGPFVAGLCQDGAPAPRAASAGRRG